MRAASKAKLGSRTPVWPRFVAIAVVLVSPLFTHGTFSQTVTVKPGAELQRAIPAPTISDWLIPICVKPGRGFKRIGWGKYGIQYPIPPHAVKIKGGKWDVDYVVYFIIPKKNSSFMRIWFGVNMYKPDPDHDLIIASPDFLQRNIRSVSDNFFGVDTWGHLRTGAKWRHTSIAESIAEYRDASQEDAALFDRIINSMCYVPYPRS